MADGDAKVVLLMDAVLEERTLIADALRSNFIVVATFNTNQTITHLVRDDGYAIALLKVVCGQDTQAGYKVLCTMQELYPRVPVILLTLEGFMEPARKLQEEFPRQVMDIIVGISDSDTICQRVQRVLEASSLSSRRRKKAIASAAT